MFSTVVNQEDTHKSLEGTVLDTDVSKKMFTTYIPQDILENEIQNPAKTYVDIPHDVDLNFAQKFIEKEGKFIYCTTPKELNEKLIQFLKINQIDNVFIWEEPIISLFRNGFIESNIKVERVIENAKLAVSYCECLVADEGTIILNPNQNRFRPLDNFPDYHIIIASKAQVKLNIEHAVSDFMLKHHDVFPFIIDISLDEKSTRFAMNKPILLSRGTKKVFIFYCEECCF